MAKVESLARRTQEERSRATRALLLDATLACLEELGYARTSTVEVARRAGVSRGAQLHHFPTKTQLVTEAFRHLFERRHAEFLKAFRQVDPAKPRYEAAIDIMWSMVSGPTFVIWLELAVAARTDPELAAAVHGLNRDFMAMVEETFFALFEAPAEPNPLFELAPRFAFTLFDGLALSRLAAGSDDAADGVVDALKALAQLVFPAAPQPGGDE